jgi:transcriptional regulator MftR-like protein
VRRRRTQPGSDRPALRELIRDGEAPRRERPVGTPNLSDLLKHPSVVSRLRERWNRWEDILGDAIAGEVGAGPDDPEPRVLAAAITGAIRVAAAAAQARPKQRKEIAARVFELLASGLSQYGATRPTRP